MRDSGGESAPALHAGYGLKLVPPLVRLSLLDPGVLDHLGPARDLAAHAAVELLRRASPHFEAEVEETLLHVGFGEDLRYLAVSTNGGVDVVEYPDSKKFAVAAGMQNGEFKTASFAHIAPEGDSLGYWDGETS